MKKEFRCMLRYSTIDIEPMKFLGFIMFFGIGMSLLLALILNAFKIISPLIGFVLSFIAIAVCFYIWIILSIDSKSRFTEGVLPDALQLMSSNIRAGLTTDKALLLAARPEFGPLGEEIREVGRNLMTGRSFDSSLRKMTEKIKSETLSKTVDLIINSMKSGGSLTDLLDQTASDIRDQQLIQKEIAASVLMYVLFIFIAIGAGAPLLFAMSSFLVKMMITMNDLIGVDTSDMESMSSMPVSMTSSQISTDFISQFAIISLFFSSLFGSLIMGLILKGTEKSGIKFFLILLVMSIGLFFIGGYVMNVMLGGMMGM